tara:strand:- start:3120 stop:3263 length:144 start_codon:yes stop_codon:yes gene_type:complete
MAFLTINVIYLSGKGRHKMLFSHGQAQNHSKKTAQKFASLGISAIHS